MEKWGIVLYGVLGVMFILRYLPLKRVSMPYEPKIEVDESVKRKLSKLKQ